MDGEGLLWNQKRSGRVVPLGNQTGEAKLASLGVMRRAKLMTGHRRNSQSELALWILVGIIAFSDDAPKLPA